jgi:hypothetical protein
MLPSQKIKKAANFVKNIKKFRLSLHFDFWLDFIFYHKKSIKVKNEIGHKYN